MIEYCCGFLFDRDRERVWLIRKARPAWQAGRLNGIGGKLEHGEFPRDAMVREFTEEAGVVVRSWGMFATLGDLTLQRRVYFFDAEADPVLFCQPRALTDEPIAPYPVAELWGRGDLLPNFRVHLALALDRSGLKKPVMLEDRR